MSFVNLSIGVAALSLGQSNDLAFAIEAALWSDI